MDASYFSTPVTSARQLLQLLLFKDNLSKVVVRNEDHEKYPLS